MLVIDFGIGAAAARDAWKYEAALCVSSYYVDRGHRGLPRCELELSRVPGVTRGKRCKPCNPMTRPTHRDCDFQSTRAGHPMIATDGRVVMPKALAHDATEGETVNGIDLSWSKAVDLPYEPDELEDLPRGR